MPLKLIELKKKHDKAYTSGQSTREKASDDLVFYHITNWDDQYLDSVQLPYRGEFDIIRKGGRQIMSELRSNPIQVDFQAIDPDREDGADLANGMYRRDDRVNTSLEAYDYATQDSVVAGFGAWELYTEYETNIIGDENQVIKRRYIPEAPNTAYCDPNAKRLDKSDAMYWSLLEAYSEDGYKELVHDLTGQHKDEIVYSSFKSPEQSFVFPWAGGEGRHIYVSSFYQKEKVKDKILTMTDPLGMSITVRESEIKDVEDELLKFGFEITGEKSITRWEVRKYIASGEEILNGSMEDGERIGEVIAGENIPVVPVYGERAIVESEEHYEGITRKAKDPQRLHNFVQSYLADIASRSARPKPIFLAEQIQGFESMYEITGADNNYPYLLQQRIDANGNELPMGAVGMMPDTPIPQALGEVIGLTRESVNDLVNPGLPQDIADPDMSGKAIQALQARMDMQSYIYQHNFKFAKRYDAQVWVGMAREIYDAPRTVRIEAPDGSTKTVKILEQVFDKKTNRMKFINDLTNIDFDVFAEIGQSYSTNKQQDTEMLMAWKQTLEADDPLRNIIDLKLAERLDGIDFKDIREYARKQLLIQGLREPDPDSEQDQKTMEQMASQQSQPDPNMVLAMAEDKKGQAALIDSQIKQARLQTEQYKMQIEEEKAKVSAVKVANEGAKSKADIANTNSDTMLKQAQARKVVSETSGHQIENIENLMNNTERN